MRTNSIALALGILVLGRDAVGQESARIVSGRVVYQGVGIPDVNVFLRETLDGALTDSVGHFRIATRSSASLTLVAQRIGFKPRTLVIAVRGDAPLAIELDRAETILAPVTAVASRFAAGEERGATLTTLDVVSTAGTTADIARAIQTLPGTQSVDEGTGLFVRGGDFAETKMLLNDATLRTTFSFESPNGTFIGTVDPFLLDGIVFASGGFGARYGDALSGVATLRTQGQPARNEYTGGVGLAALSASAARAITPRFGVRIAANQTDTRTLFKVNGSTQEYDPAPRGYDRSGSAIWNYRPSGEVKVFAIAQRTALGTLVEEASHAGTFTLGITGTLIVANWSDSIGRLRPYARLSRTQTNRAEDYGSFRLTTAERFIGASGGTELVLSELLTLRAGVEREGLNPALDGAIPQTSHDKKPTAPSIAFHSSPSASRTGVFAEADFVVLRRARLAAGVRRDASTLTGRATVDPRISTAITVVPGVVVSGAWGIYHQVPDPIFYDPTLGDPALPPMRATHSIAGIQLGSEGTLLRLEGYDKRYGDLAQTTRDYDVVGGGTGRARGVDIFAAGAGWRGMRWRYSQSLLSSERTDPHTGALATAAFDIPTTSTSVIQQMLPRGFHVALTHRHASGKPYTPVLGASHDATANVWVPTYGPHMSERLPPFDRYDAGLTHLRTMRGTQAVFYFSVNNLLDRDNLLMYRYSTDYSVRVPIRSLFNRSYYFGASFTR